jgi:hypothetical protein
MAYQLEVRFEYDSKESDKKGSEIFGMRFTPPFVSVHKDAEIKVFSRYNNEFNWFLIEVDKAIRGLRKSEVNISISYDDNFPKDKKQKLEEVVRLSMKSSLD